MQSEIKTVRWNLPELQWLVHWCQLDFQLLPVAAGQLVFGPLVAEAVLGQAEQLELMVVAHSGVAVVEPEDQLAAVPCGVAQLMPKIEMLSLCFCMHYDLIQYTVI